MVMIAALKTPAVLTWVDVGVGHLGLLVGGRKEG